MTPTPPASRAGRTYLVTGTTGIAAATARLAALDGARIFLVGKERESGEALAREIRESGAECGLAVADLTRPEEVAAAVATCVAEVGRIDALFNVAGISGRRFGDGPIHECTVEGWEATLDTNARSVFLMCREVLRHMLGQPRGERGLRGVILNMASVLALSPEPRFFATHAYAASKGAILGLTRSMAAYYAPHRIRVNAIAPSLVRTPMSRRAQENAEIVDFMRVKQPLVDGLIEADEVARAALFLLGSDARVVTGEVLRVDAGWSVSG